MELNQTALKNTKNLTVCSKRIVKNYLNQTAQDAGRVIQCFLNSDMRNGHDGLAAIAGQYSINVNNLNNGQYLVFINRSRTMVKVYAERGVIAFYRSHSGPINMETIQLIPQAFRSHGTLHYDSILKETLEAALERKRR